jgi:hypothetical protein
MSTATLMSVLTLDPLRAQQEEVHTMADKLQASWKTQYNLIIGDECKVTTADTAPDKLPPQVFDRILKL